MEISAEAVKTLRERTGAGILNCKKALTEANGDIEKAIEVLRKEGLAQAAKKLTRTAENGLVEAYIHAGGRVGVLLELNCETDFVAKTEEFKELAKDLAMQIAAMAPEYVSPDQVPAEILEKEKEILKAQAEAEGKPANVIEKMVEGRLKKFYSIACLLNQEFIRDEGKKRTIEQVVKEGIAKLGENLVVRRFARFKLGEG